MDIQGPRGLLKKITDYPLTVIEAPMGYGKTTAMFLELNSACAVKLLEVSLREDNVTSKMKNDVDI